MNLQTIIVSSDVTEGNNGDQSLTVLGILAQVGGRAPAEHSDSQADRGCSDQLPAEPPPDKEGSSALARGLKGRACVL